MFTHLILSAVGLALLLAGADLLVRGSRILAMLLGISPLVIGLTVVAFGTSAPELFVSLTAAYTGSADVAIGNVVGSNIFNILAIVGIAAIIIPIHISSSVITREMPIMLLSSLLFYWTASDGIISRIEGVMLLFGIVVYLLYHYVMIKRGGISAVIEEIEPLKSKKRASVPVAVLFVVVGLAGLIYGSGLAVDHGASLARLFGVSEFIIGVTLIAAGTSLPELATTVLAACKGEPDLAIGNAVGSNIFNVFAVIGLTGTVTPLQVAPSALALDFPFMVASAAVVWPIMILQRHLSRTTGLILLGGYAAYIWLTLTNGAL